MNDIEVMRADLMQRIAERLPQLDAETLKAIASCYDKAASAYNIETKCTALTVWDPFPDEAKQYLVAKKIEGYSDKTLHNRALLLRLFFTAVRKPVREIVTNDVRLYLYQYQQARGVSDRTLEGVRLGLQAFFNWMIDSDLVEKNPLRNIKPIKYEEKPRHPLSRLELEYWRSACRTERETAIIEFLYSTGCRCGEIVLVKVSDINWENSELTVFGKGKQYRTVYLSARCVVALQAYLRKRNFESEYLFAGERKPHGMIVVDTIEKILRKIERNVEGMDRHITPHFFRHTTATHAIRAGMPMEQVQKMLGHKSMDTTRIYAEIEDDSVKISHSKYIV